MQPHRVLAPRAVLRSVAALAVVGSNLVVGACAPTTQAPTAAGAAAHLGLVAATSITFDVGGGLTETHTIMESSVLVPEHLVFDIVARDSGGFLVEDRTFSIAVGPEAATLVRFSDCVRSCRLPMSPIAFVSIPLDGGRSSETTVDVKITDSSGAETSVEERHTVVVSEAKELSTPAGLFEAHAVSWTRARAGSTSLAVAHIAPGTGIVAWDGFDGKELRRLE